MDGLEQLLRKWWSRLTAWMHSPERSAQAAEATRKAKAALHEVRESDAARRAEAALRDLRDSDASRKAKEALRDLRDDLRTGDAGRKAGDAGRKAKAAIRDLRGGSDS